MKVREPVFRIVFVQASEKHELFAQFVSAETMEGFIEVGQFVAPTDENYVTNKEFENVVRSYIPIHTIIRIDEMSGAEGLRFKDREISEQVRENIWHFPKKT